MEKKKSKKVIKDEEEKLKKASKRDNQNERNIVKMNKILSDNNAEDKVFDLLFVIDATGSMSSYIRAAKDETENISKELRNLYPEYNFQYGYIFYRDPIDSPGDKHEIIDLTDKVNTLPDEIKKMRAYGGGDLPEDWVGAFKLANESINWRNGMKVIIHLADAGAHGKEFTLSDKYPEESDKLKQELLKCCQKKIKIFGYVITEDARHSFNQSQNYYRSNGGCYEICEFKIPEMYADSSSEEIEHRRRKCKKSRCKRKCIKDEENDESDSDSEEEEKCKRKCKKKSKRKEMEYSDEDEYEDDKMEKGKAFCVKEKNKSSKQNKINTEFRVKVIDSIKSII
jgi:hypothetical protein